MALLILHLPTLALNATATLIYPLYSSYKAVTSSTTSLGQMEVWLVYWSVFACWTLLESSFGFLWSWIPFYYELRLLFNVWLVAPQTRGATYIYTNHLHPFLQSNQELIDEKVEEVKAQVRARLEGVLGGFFSVAAGGGGGGGAVGEQGVGVGGKGEARHKPPATGSAPAPPTQHNPAQAPMGMLGNLVKTYAPVAIASAKSFLESKAPPPNVAAYNIPAGNHEEALARRRQLESQLAALDGVSSNSNSNSNSSGEDEVPVTVMGNPGRGGPQGSLRNRIVSGGRTVKAGTAMGESYDLLDQNDLSPVQGGRRKSWVPWSPKAE